MNGTKGGAGPPKFSTAEARSAQKKSVIRITNDDNSCFARAVYVGIRYHELKIDEGVTPNNRKPWLQACSTEAQTDGAQELCRQAGTDFSKQANEATMKSFQELVLKDKFQLIVVDGAGRGPKRTIRYRGHAAEKQIYLEYMENALDNGHFNFIKKMSAYLGRRYYCAPCNYGFDRIESHYCDSYCKFCHEAPRCVGPFINITCADCKRTFLSESCYKRHANKICKLLHKCENCEVEYNTTRKHVCGSFLCRKCSTQTSDTPHYCMLRRLDREKIRKQDEVKKIFIACDIECQLKPIKTMVSGREVKAREHEPMLMMCLTVCDACWCPVTKKKLINSCDFCGEGEKTFRGSLCVPKFADYVYKLASTTKSPVIVFAHNLRSYDGHFLLQDLFKRDFLDTSVIMTGNKILKMEWGGVRFIDSLSFFNQPLAALPKAFGLEESKGFFPYLFNVKENSDYCGKIPDLKFFDLENSSASKRADILKWHATWEGDWSLQVELEKYCKSDVSILSQAMMTFRSDFVRTTGNLT